jgi:type IV pilus assembly protein PilF
MAWMPRFIIILVILALTSCYHVSHGEMNMLTPNTQLAHSNAQLGLAYLQKGYTDLAQEKIQLALTEAPHDPLVLDSMGYYYEKTGESELANKYFLGALLYNPDSKAARDNYKAFLYRNRYDQ